MVRRILDLQSDFFQLLLLLSQFCVFLLDIEDLMHVFLEYPLKVFNGILGLFIHGPVFLDVKVVLLQLGLYLLLCSLEIVPHFLIHVGHFLIQLIRLKQQILIRSLLRLVGDLCSLERSRQLLSLLGDLCLPIIGSLIFVLDSREILLEYPHGFIEGVVVLLGIIDDFEERFDDPRHLIELILSQLALLVEVLHRFSAVLHVHSDQVLFVAHLCITYIQITPPQPHLPTNNCPHKSRRGRRQERQGKGVAISVHQISSSGIINLLSSE